MLPVWTAWSCGNIIQNTNNMKTENEIPTGPWLDYFEMLQAYEKKGFLNMYADKHEAYITEPALFTLSPERDVKKAVKGVPDILRYIRTYGGWISQEGVSYIEKPFALHVVTSQYPHDLLYTIVISRKRTWWLLMFKRDRLDVIDYRNKSQKSEEGGKN